MANIESRLIDVEGKIIALDAKINTLALQVQRLAEPAAASDRSKIRNRIAEANDWQGLKILMLELASEMEELKGSLELLEGKNRQSSKAATHHPQSDSGE